jgi:hypothetical protein
MIPVTECAELMQRLETLRVSGDCTTLLLNPVGRITSSVMPAIVVFEVGPDIVIEYSQRGRSGYPVKRESSVVIELWVGGTDYATMSAALNALYNKLRLLFNTGKLIDVLIREERTLGPTDAGVETSLGFGVHYIVTYVDSGPSGG